MRYLDLIECVGHNPIKYVCYQYKKEGKKECRDQNYKFNNFTRFFLPISLIRLGQNDIFL